MQLRSGTHVYWGDLHNHNSAGAARGSMPRTVSIARANLDFFAYTGQAQWHDMPEASGEMRAHWLDGFARHRSAWDSARIAIEEANQPGTFAAFHGYEWHSSTYGDYNIIFPGAAASLGTHSDILELASWARESGAILIPHHLGYATGGRGANWDSLPTDIVPVVEIFSEHGAGERDEGPFPYIRHGLGPRETGNDYQGALARGFHVGAVASSDSHVGFPGAYAQGLTAVFADSLDRDAIIDAIRRRKVYAVTGDRIGLEFSINAHPMGSILPSTPEREIVVRVEAEDRVRDVEILRNNRVIYRAAPLDIEPSTTGQVRMKIRIEFGWGPWSMLGAGRTCDWDMSVEIGNGELMGVTPCFGVEAFDDERVSVITNVNPNGCSFIAYTSPGQFEERPDGVVLDVLGTVDSTLTVVVRSPTRSATIVAVKELLHHHRTIWTAGFQSEVVHLHRAVLSEESDLEVRFDDRGRDGSSEDSYYVRVTQDNGQMAWSSPIWVQRE